MEESSMYVSLDIGSSTVKVLIGEMDGKTLHVIGVGNVHSDGIRKGTIVDIDATVRSIEEAVAEAEQMTGRTVREVVLGIPANDIQLQPVKGVVAVNSENQEITDDDLMRVIDSAQVMSVSPDREIVNVVPKQFKVDDYDEIEDPRGMLGVRLEMEGLLITASKTLIHNILRCVERAGLTIREIYLQPLAAGTFALTKDEINHGTAFIDIGGDTTTVSLFEERHLIRTTIIPIGGEHVTKDIAIVLKTPTEEARKIQYEFGHAYSNDASAEEVFDVVSISSSTTEQYSQKEVSHIIEARLEELFEYILQELYDMGVDDLPGGIVLTGGTTKLEGILPLAVDVLKTRVRIHVPTYLGVREPMYTTSVGLIQYAAAEDRFFGTKAAPVVDERSDSFVEEHEFFDDDDDYDDYYEEEPRRRERKGTIVERTKRFFTNFFE